MSPERKGSEVKNLLTVYLAFLFFRIKNIKNPMALNVIMMLNTANISSFVISYAQMPENIVSNTLKIHVLNNMNTASARQSKHIGYIKDDIIPLFISSSF